MTFYTVCLSSRTPGCPRNISMISIKHGRSSIRVTVCFPDQEAHKYDQWPTIFQEIILVVHIRTEVQNNIHGDDLQVKMVNTMLGVTNKCNIIQRDATIITSLSMCNSLSRWQQLLVVTKTQMSWLNQIFFSKCPKPAFSRPPSTITKKEIKVKITMK